MFEVIKNYFFPDIDQDVKRLMDENCVRILERISLIVTIFESVTLALFVLTRKDRLSELKGI